MEAKNVVNIYDIQEKETLQYALGGLMYVPGHNQKIADMLIQKKYPELRSLAICLEDSIPNGTEMVAIDNVVKQINAVQEALDVEDITEDDIPYIFVRVKEPKHMRIITKKLSASPLIKGFIFPKFDFSNAESYLETLRDINRYSDHTIYGMPILESGDIILPAMSSRVELLTHLKTLVDTYRSFILNIRVGGNDFCGAFGVRRDCDETIYDLPLISNILTDIATVFSQDYVVSGAVWEYFYNAEDNSEHKDDWKTGLANEIKKDIKNGFTGKTVIHPTQLGVINEALKVNAKDYNEAKEVLEWHTKDHTNDIVAVKKSVSGNRMTEYYVHLKWAKKIVILGDIYGVK